MSRPTNRRRPPAPWVWQLSPDKPGPTHESVLEQLRSVILAGQAPPGATINVDDVADRLVVSRIPVREALKTLIGEGLVAHQPGSGYRVTQLTRAELAELYVVREALENAALSTALARASGRDDLEVDAALTGLIRAIDQQDARGHHRESRRFHLALATPCGMQRLLRMFESAWNITEPQQPMSHVSPEMTHALHEDHVLMAAAFHDRDAATLLAASSQHYRNLQQVVATLPPTGLLD